MNSSMKILLVPVIAALIMIAGITAALASEVTGDLSSTGTTTSSYRDGALVATISEPQTEPEAAQPAAAEPRGGRSGSHRKAPYGGTIAASPSSGYDPIIILDGGSIASAAEFTGTGGGFDRAVEQAIQSAGGESDTSITPMEAVAFNASQNPFVGASDLTAATEDSDIGSARIWTAIVLGLALLGLAGYAVNALISYRRDNDL